MKSQEKTLDVPFIDFKWTCSWIPRPLLSKVLKKRLGLIKLVDALELLYKATSAEIKDSEERFNAS